MFFLREIYNFSIDFSQKNYLMEYTTYIYDIGTQHVLMVPTSSLQGDLLKYWVGDEVDPGYFHGSL